MRSKLARFWSVRRVRNTFFPALLFFVGLPHPAFALTVAPISTIDGVTGLSNNVINSSAYFYPSNSSTTTYPLSSTLFVDTSDPAAPGHVYDLTQTQAQLSTSQTDMLRFQIASTTAITAPASPAKVVLSVFVSVNGAYKPIPIALYEPGPSFAANGGASCAVAGPCVGPVTDTINGLIYYTGVTYTPQTTVQIGIYPRDICNLVAHYYNSTIIGCSGEQVDARGGNSPITLKFVIGTSPDGVGAATAPDAASSGVFDSLDNIALAFVTGGATTTCPNPTDIYFPGDGQIIFNANVGTNIFTTSTPSGLAPITNVVMVGNEGGSVTFAGNYSSTNSVHTVLPSGAAGRPVAGFLNSDQTAHPYTIGYMLRDAAGVLTLESNTANCQLSGVETSAIRGFLNESSCFIATAAFDSIDAAPVDMLRHFRDSVLLHSDAGRLFVKWYYHWSPNAAEWLLRHPIFRFPVLLALIPVEAIAWLFLHPAWLAVLMVLNLVVLMRSLRGWKGAARES